jgi:hypothetical protein
MEAVVGHFAMSGSSDHQFSLFEVIGKWWRKLAVLRQQASEGRNVSYGEAGRLAPKVESGASHDVKAHAAKWPDPTNLRSSWVDRS